MADIFEAVREGDGGEVTRLLDADPELLEAQNAMRQGPLAMAAKLQHLGVVRLLIERGANISATDPEVGGGTVLHHAAVWGHEEVVALLLKKGAQANLRDDREYTPLMEASLEGHVGVMRLLLQHTEGQGLDRGNREGNTALHCAVRWGQAEAVRLLLFAGADATITNNEGRTPSAEAEYRIESSDLLEELEMEDLEEAIAMECAQCMNVLEWWEGELERRRALCRALCLHKAYTTQRDQPASQVPTYLEARVAVGHAVPHVDMVSPQSQEEKGQAGTSGRIIRNWKALDWGAADERDAEGADEEEEEETMCAVVEYVVKVLNEDLATELLEGLYGEK